MFETGGVLSDIALLCDMLTSVGSEYETIGLSENQEVDMLQNIIAYVIITQL